MALGSQLPIRLEQSVDERLNAAAIKTGNSKSALIRLLATTFVEQCIDESGRVTLPPDWDALLAERDRRSGSAKFDGKAAPIVQPKTKDKKNTYEGAASKKRGKSIPIKSE